MKHHFIAGSLGVIACFSAIAGSPWDAAQAVPFTPPPDNSSPSEATGGASRGSTFVPPRNNLAPQQSTGGASRGSVFAPPTNNAAPQQSTGGASRGSIFAPPTNNSAPQQATGGASRGVFTPPTDNAAPQQSTGGASRTNLQGDYIGAGRAVSMMAIAPQSFYGTTLSDRPTFMAYVPASNAHEVVFSLKDADDNMHYQMRLPISGESGMMAIQLPANAPPLEVGKNYHWYVAILVDGSMSPSTPFVDAWVQRIEASPQLQQALTQGTDLQDAEALATQGVWYDSVALLAHLRSSDPTSKAVASNWAELLNSVDLAEVVKAPMAVW
jgi:Domain of Unknown Function (DUF928)